MLKYKDKYLVKYQRDSEGKIYNRDDNYISCRSRGQIYRKDKDTLVFVSPKRIQLIKRDKDTKEIIMDYAPLILSIWDTDEEREITFLECNLEQLEDLFKIRKRKHLSEEAKEKAKIRMQQMWSGKNIEITDEDLESLADESDDMSDDSIASS